MTKSCKPRDEWTTPKKLVRWLDLRFDFNVDAAASPKNRLFKKYYHKNNSFLEISEGELISKHRIFCNPPYSLAKEFSELLLQLFYSYGVSSYILLPVRSDRMWYQELLHSAGVRQEPFTGRIHFGGSGKGAFMYNIGVVLGFSEVVTHKWVDAGQFNTPTGKGSART